MLLLAALATAAQPQYCDFRNTPRRCRLCTASAAAPPRQDTVYTASGRCDSDVAGVVELPPGGYVMAAGQTIVGSRGVTISGQLAVTTPGVTIRDVALTRHVAVSGRDVSNMAIANVVVNDTVAVHMAGSHDGLVSLNAAGATIDHVDATAPNAAVAAIINTVRGPAVTCATDATTRLVVRDDPTPQPPSAATCKLLSLSEVFQVYGAKQELEMFDEAPSPWLANVYAYNWYATQAALLALVAFATISAQ